MSENSNVTIFWSTQIFSKYLNTLLGTLEIDFEFGKLKYTWGVSHPAPLSLVIEKEILRPKEKKMDESEKAAAA